MSDQYKPDGMDTTLAFVAMLIAFPWGGFVLAKLWAWFVVPLGVTPLTWAHAAAIAVLVRGFLGSRPFHPRDEQEFVAEYVGAPIVRPLIALCFGFILRGFLT